MDHSNKNVDRQKKRRSKNVVLIWLEFIPFWFLYQTIRIVPIKFAYKLIHLLSRLLLTVDFKHRNRTLDHIMHANVAANRKQALQIARQAFYSLGSLLVEIIKMDQFFKPERISIKSSPEGYDRTFGEHKGNVIGVSAHYGNWELAGSFWATLSDIPVVSIMRPFSNPLIGKYILRGREASNHQSISKDGGIRGLMRALKEGKSIALLVDQHASTREGGIETIFFGQPCRTHSSPAILHLKTGIPILPQVTRRLDENGHFEFIMGDMIEYKPTGDKEKDIQTVTQMYTTALEKIIAADPTQWMWAHRRWLNLNRKHARHYQKLSEESQLR